MPELVPITNNFFVNLINRLGLKPPPVLGWGMTTVVQPVSLVDSDITLTAVSTSIVLDTPVTAGPLAAGTAALTVLADTGALPAGNYAVLIFVGGDLTAGTLGVYTMQRRDAANAANIWAQEFSTTPPGSSLFTLPFTVTLQQNERLRVLNKTLTTYTTTHVSIWVRQA